MNQTNRRVGTRSFLFVAAILGGYMGTAAAEGRCPAGMYPIDGMGWAGCAPIPGYVQPAPGAASTAPPPPRWLPTWGALAMDSERGRVGQSVGEFNEADALARAIESCVSIGGRDCRELITYVNECVAVAVPVVNDKTTAGTVLAFRGKGIEAVRAAAVDRCKRKGNAECRTVYSACVEPFRVN